MVGAKCVAISASITGEPPLRFVARSYVLGLCRDCFICSNPDSDGKYGTACKLGGRLATDAFSFVTAKSSGLFLVACMVMRNASLPSASALVPVLLGCLSLKVMLWVMV